MSITADLTRLIVGLFFGIVLPRIPLLFFTRFLNLERDLTPHPDPIPIGVPLVQRLLLMRRIHTMCWLIALLPLVLGFLILKFGGIRCQRFWELNFLQFHLMKESFHQKLII